MTLWKTANTNEPYCNNNNSSRKLEKKEEKKKYGAYKMGHWVATENTVQKKKRRRRRRGKKKLLMFNFADITVKCDSYLFYNCMTVIAGSLVYSLRQNEDQKQRSIFFFADGTKKRIIYNRHYIIFFMFWFDVVGRFDFTVK